jgi:hypothetical protein
MSLKGLNADIDVSRNEAHIGIGRKRGDQSMRNRKARERVATRDSSAFILAVAATTLVVLAALITALS